MVGARVAGDLTHHHRDTLNKLFGHSRSGNLEWRELRSLLAAVGTVRERHNGKIEVTIGPETEVISPPRTKDVDKQILVDIRRMLRDAGLAPGGGPAIEDERSRDHGDGRWGSPH
jgi:hypothetical protein